MKLSIILPVRNRAKLLRRALECYVRQTLPKDQWEVILVDEMSTEDLSTAYAHLVGELNLTHVRMDPTRHPLVVAGAPRVVEGEPLEGRHEMPALAMNLGMSLAQGQHLCLSHPEILQAPTNAEVATGLLDVSPRYLFGVTYLGTGSTNRRLDSRAKRTRTDWNKVFDAILQDELRSYRGTELYWYTTFLPRSVALEVGGVDLAYLGGAGGDDDDFRERVSLAGYRPRMTPNLQFLHQYHAGSPRLPRLEDRAAWEEALARNRALFGSRRRNWLFPPRVNLTTDWSGRQCISSFRRLELSRGIRPAEDRARARVGAAT